MDDAYSGVLTLEKGDSIEFECEIANDLDQTLYFANKAYTADMCNMFGFYTPSMNAPLACTTF